MGIGAILALVVAATLLTVRATHANRIFPAVTVADVPVGGMTLSGAAEAISARAAAIGAVSREKVERIRRLYPDS